jgi:hypothetical protein
LARQQSTLGIAALQKRSPGLKRGCRVPHAESMRRLLRALTCWPTVDSRSSEISDVLFDRWLRPRGSVESNMRGFPLNSTKIAGNGYAVTIDVPVYRAPFAMMCVGGVRGVLRAAKKRGRSPMSE